MNIFLHFFYTWPKKRSLTLPLHSLTHFNSLTHFHNQESRRSVAKWINPDSHPVHNQLEGRSIAPRLVPTHILSNLRVRDMGWWVGLGSVGPKGAGWVPARSLLTSTLARCVLAGWLAGWLDSHRYLPPIPLVWRLRNKKTKNMPKRAPSPTKVWIFAWKFENRPIISNFEICVPDPQLHQIFKTMRKFFYTFYSYNNLS